MSQPPKTGPLQKFDKIAFSPSELIIYLVGGILCGLINVNKNAFLSNIHRCVRSQSTAVYPPNKYFSDACIIVSVGP